MKNYYTIIWFGFIALFVGAISSIIFFISNVEIFGIMFFILSGTGFVVLMYSLFFGLLFPVLYDLYKEARKLDKGIE